MRRLLFILLSVFTFVYGANDARAQENDEIKTLFKSKAKVTGFGAFDVRYGEIDAKNTFFLGGNGGVIFNGHLYMGIGAYGQASNVEIDTEELGALKLYSGYTGIILGYNIAPKKLIHIHIPVNIALGAAELYKEGGQVGEIFIEEFFVDQYTFLIVEPAINIEVNFTKFLKISIGGGYRFADGLSSPYINADMFKSYSINFSIIGGKFY